ncbi:MAG TPA: VWA domain-containing protein [Pyrinomonadaceae bacterium]|nr:VWA domain-containing protein [Pyrinomonadaceae bacterium]
MAEESVEESFKKQLRPLTGNGERRSLTKLAKDLSKLPADKSRAALETSANLAGVSLRVSGEFLQAAALAGEILSADELRMWGEIGRKLAMTNADVGANFFARGVADYAEIPVEVRQMIFQVCQRQLILSGTISLETFHNAPQIARQVADAEILHEVFRVASEIAQRSAKHSADFLRATPETIKSFEHFGTAEEKTAVARSAADLATRFAARAGGMAADLWESLPDALQDLSREDSIHLLQSAAELLEYGGSVTLHFVLAGGEGLRRVPASFDAWRECLQAVAKHGNAVLVAFVRSSPAFFRQISTVRKPDELSALTVRVLNLTREIAEIDAEAALASFRASARALRQVSAGQFEDWVKEGLKPEKFDNSRARRSFFALETRRSNDRLHEGAEGLPLDAVQTTLRLYIEALTGKQIEVSPLAAVPNESRMNDGKTIYLPSSVSEFGDDELDFRLFKVLAAHAAGQIEFGTHEKDTPELKAAFANLAELYEATAEERDAFSLAGYLEDVQTGEKALPAEVQALFDREARKILPPDSDYRAALAAFPQPMLARKIFTTLENGRIDRHLRRTYKGLRRDLDLMQKLMQASRPVIMDLPVNQIPFELLFQITLCGGARDDARKFFTQIVIELESVVFDYLSGENAGVADTLMATSRVYSLFQSMNAEQQQNSENAEDSENDSKNENTGENAIEVFDKNAEPEERSQKLSDARDLFNAWNNLEEDVEPEDWNGAESWGTSEVPEQPLEAGEIAFAYDEWDRELGDFRTGWCRVVEKKTRRGDRNFVDLTRERYRGVISSVRHQFQLMKPENLLRIHNEIDGDDYDLNAVIDYVIDRRADGKQTDRIYTKKLRKQRDVAVSFLLDQSSSTARTITRNPLQPYTNPGRRIIEIEKEGLVLMSEALEAVGDVYSIYGFTSEGRRNVKFYIVKDFQEKYSEEIERRIGGITFQNNTRLGAAIRHAAHKLLRQDARTKLLVILTDGRPYDHDYGDAKYAREDVREALRDAKLNGIMPFCITIDRDSEAELKDLYGDVGYTIIDDVLNLPERLPNIYRRLTS